MMLYIHIPFCIKKCLYCDFVSFPNREGDICAYVDALFAEMRLRPCKKPLSSIFIGGGTPSMLDARQLTRLCEGIFAQYSVEKGAEVTIEVNPGTVDAAWLNAANTLSINRLSIGVQAFDDGLLKALGRIHTKQQALQTIEAAKSAGFSNISIDLMYGLPNQSLAQFTKSLDTAISLDLPHVSCYNLIIEEGTPFHRLFEKGSLSLPDEELELAMWEEARARLGRAGLLQYEVSNYAKDGFESRHNMGYWKRSDYIGLGLSAHSLEDGVRKSNTPDLSRYLQSLQGGQSPAEQSETLCIEDICFEELMLGLRLVNGIALSDAALHLYASRLDQLQTRGLLERNGRHVKLTERGFPIMNHVLTTLMED